MMSSHMMSKRMKNAQMHILHKFTLRVEILLSYCYHYLSQSH